MKNITKSIRCKALLPQATSCRSFSTTQNVQDTSIGFDRKMEQVCAGTVAPYKRHLFLCSGTTDWPNEISKWPGHFIESFSMQLRKNLGPKFTQIRFTATNEPSKYQGSFDLLLWPGGIKLHNINSSNSSKLVELLEKEPSTREDIQSAVNYYQLEHSWMRPEEKWVFVCAHQSRDARCGFCGPILINKLQENLSSNPNIHVRACSHVGGHEYAGNVLVYPIGEWFGYVTPNQVEELAQWIKQPSNQQHENIGQSQVLKNLWRGNMGQSKEEQKIQAASWGIKFSEKN